MWKALLVAAVIAGAFATEQTTASPTTGGTKNETAGGHYYGNQGGYYPPPPPPPYYPAYSPPIVDDYVCDIDATILVVTNTDSYSSPGYGNQNNGNQNTPYGGGNQYPQKQPNADRLKCSVIATFDEATCTSCCRIAARRDRSIASSSIIGFIVDDTQLDYDQNDNNNGPYRAKRETYSVPGGIPSRNPPAYAPPSSDANPLGPNGRCVCCAPRKFGFPHFHPRPYPY